MQVAVSHLKPPHGCFRIETATVNIYSGYNIYATAVPYCQTNTSVRSGARTMLYVTAVAVDQRPRLPEEADNTRSLSASLNETWKLWNSRTGELQHTEQMAGYSCCCSFSPNGSFFLVGCDNGLRLHDSKTCQLQHTLTGHSEAAMSCSFAPDGATILSGSNDHTMKLWSATTGQCLRTLVGNSGCITSCSFAPSGHDIYNISDDGTIAMWTAATGQLARIENHRRRPHHRTDLDLRLARREVRRERLWRRDRKDVVRKIGGPSEIISEWGFCDPTPPPPRIYYMPVGKNES
jgi:WD40 repeat protein